MGLPLLETGVAAARGRHSHLSAPAIGECRTRMAAPGTDLEETVIAFDDPRSRGSPLPETPPEQVEQWQLAFAI